MKYIVTATASDEVEVDAESEEEALELGKKLLPEKTYFDFYDVDEA